MKPIDLFFLFGLLYVIQSIIIAIYEAVKKTKDETDYNIGAYVTMEPNKGIAFIKKHLNAGCILTFLYFGWVIAGFWTDQKFLFIALFLLPILTLVIMQGKQKDSKQGKTIMAIDFIINKLLILAIVYKHFENVF